MLKEETIKVTKKNNVYICPDCQEEYSATDDEVLTFYEYECPRCNSTVIFDGENQTTKRRNY